MLAGLNPLGVIVAALFFAGIYNGADSMSRSYGCVQLYRGCDYGRISLDGHACGDADPYACPVQGLRGALWNFLICSSI